MPTTSGDGEDEQDQATDSKYSDETRSVTCKLDDSECKTTGRRKRYLTLALVMALLGIGGIVALVRTSRHRIAEAFHRRRLLLWPP